MTSRNRWPLACCAALMMLFFSASAHAQFFAVFISGNGSDANNCVSPTTACRTLGKAQTAVLSGGVIHVLPGGYSALLITKAVQIIADGGQASITGSTTNVGDVQAAIVVNAGPTDVVKIRGMIFDRHGSLAGGGVGLVAGGALHLENCTLVNAAGNYGINFQPAGDSELSVSNCTIANDGAGSDGGGILIRPPAGGSAKVVVNNTRILNNRRGIEVFNRSSVIVRNSTISGNGIGVRAAGDTAIVAIADSTISANTTGLATQGGQIISRRGNVLFDNVADGAFTSAVNQQ